jgi:hypothetical protein
MMFSGDAGVKDIGFSAPQIGRQKLLKSILRMPGHEVTGYGRIVFWGREELAVPRR